MGDYRQISSDTFELDVASDRVFRVSSDTSPAGERRRIGELYAGTERIARVMYEPKTRHLEVQPSGNNALLEFEDQIIAGKNIPDDVSIGLVGLLQALRLEHPR
jgi:hypothetical protein